MNNESTRRLRRLWSGRADRAQERQPTCAQVSPTSQGVIEIWGRRKAPCRGSAAQTHLAHTKTQDSGSPGPRGPDSASRDWQGSVRRGRLGRIEKCSHASQRFPRGPSGQAAPYRPQTALLSSAQALLPGYLVSRSNMALFATGAPCSNNAPPNFPLLAISCPPPFPPVQWKFGVRAWIFEWSVDLISSP